MTLGGNNGGDLQGGGPAGTVGNIKLRKVDARSSDKSHPPAPLRLPLTPETTLIITRRDDVYDVMFVCFFFLFLTQLLLNGEYAAYTGFGNRKPSIKSFMCACLFSVYFFFYHTGPLFIAAYVLSSTSCPSSLVRERGTGMEMRDGGGVALFRSTSVRS